MSNTIPKGIKDLDEYKNLVGQKTSALSNLNQANQTAMKYADNTALAQGYATQGARLQNASNLQSAYINQAGGINQNFQKQLGNLANTTSQNQFDNYKTRIYDAVKSGTLNQEYLNQIYNDANQGGLMQQSDLTDLTNLGNDALKNYNTQESLRKTQEDETFKTSLLKEAINNGLSFEQANNLVDSYNGNKIESQLSLIQMMEDNVKTQGQEGNATGQVDPKTNKTTFKTSSGTNYISDLSSKSSGGWGKNFVITIGTTDYKMELGNKVKDANLDASKIEVGQIVLYKTSNGTYLITKDPKGNIRYATTRNGNAFGIGVNNEPLENIKGQDLAVSREKYLELAKQLGYTQ